MAINFPKNDYSYLFQSMGTSSSGSAGNLNFLGEYASIKNGSYGKLMKAYYSLDGNDTVSSIVKKNTSADDKKTLTKIQNTSESLKESADKLLTKGDKSVFSGDKLTEDAYKAVDALISDYNDVLNASDKINSTSILSKTISMTTYTEANENLLSKVGITINDDNSLSIDKDTFMKADLTTVKSIFTGAGSFSYRISAQASMINFAADSEANKAATYTNQGTYNTSYNAGNIYDSLF